MANKTMNPDSSAGGATSVCDCTGIVNPRGGYPV